MLCINQVAAPAYGDFAAAVLLLLVMMKIEVEVVVFTRVGTSILCGESRPQFRGIVQLIDTRKQFAQCILRNFFEIKSEENSSRLIRTVYDSILQCMISK